MTEPKKQLPNHPDFKTEPTTFGDTTDKNIEPRAKDYFAFIQKAKNLKKEWDEAKKDRDKAEELLIQTLENANLSQAKIDGLGIFFFKYGFHASIEAAKKSEGFQWIRDQGHGDLIGESITATTFSGFIKELIDEDEDIELPEFVQTFTKKGIGYRRK